MVVAVLLLISVFLAMNMGASGFSVSFAPSFGSNVLRKNTAALLYGLCVFAGAVSIGPRVVDTLARKVTASELSLLSGGIILGSCAVTMFLSNLLRVPQSTSLVTVASFLGAGLASGKVNWNTVTRILLFAAAFSALSLFVTVLIKRRLYPPHGGNIRLYERLFIHREKFKKFVILHDLYAGFGIGTNNVANVVAPLVASSAISPTRGIMLMAPVFAVGAFLLGPRMLRSVSKEIVPLGEFSASIVSLITATFVLIASSLGLPAPYVQFTTFSLLGVSYVKDGLKVTAGKSVVKRIMWVWFIIPVFTVLLSYALHRVFAGVEVSSPAWR